jgi:16S rRNA G1207 methylase RsmC
MPIRFSRAEKGNTIFLRREAGTVKVLFMTEHYYSEKPESQIKEREFECRILASTLSFTSVSGVFAFDNKVDRASELLIEYFKPSGVHHSVLDVGCGYGPIALFIKDRYPHLDVHAVDINERAVLYARRNAERNGIYIKVLKSNLYEGLGDIKFGDIVSNPPLAAGKALNTSLIQEARMHLAIGGSLQIVAFHNKGGETLKGIMRDAFGNAEDVVKSGGIRVYRSIRAE